MEETFDINQLDDKEPVQDVWWGNEDVQLSQSEITNVSPLTVEGGTLSEPFSLYEDGLWSLDRIIDDMEPIESHDDIFSELIIPDLNDLNTVGGGECQELQQVISGSEPPVVSVLDDASRSQGPSCVPPVIYLPSVSPAIRIEDENSSAGKSKHLNRTIGSVQMAKLYPGASDRISADGKTRLIPLPPPLKQRPDVFCVPRPPPLTKKPEHLLSQVASAPKQKKLNKPDSNTTKADSGSRNQVASRQIESSDERDIPTVKRTIPQPLFKKRQETPRNEILSQQPHAVAHATAHASTCNVKCVVGTGEVAALTNVKITKSRMTPDASKRLSVKTTTKTTHKKIAVKKTRKTKENNAGWVVGDIWEYEKILDSKVGPKSCHFYKVKWKGWGNEFNSWIPENDFCDDSSQLSQFWNTVINKTNQVNEAVNNVYALSSDSCNYFNF